jgi:superfamily II DNA or RNA helicase
VVGDGLWEPQRFTAATFQTLYRTRDDLRTQELLRATGGLIVDECHVLPSDSFLHVAQLVPAYYRFGVSGTPLARGDRRSLMAVAMLGPVVHRIRFEELAEEGILARPKIRLVRCEQAGRASPDWHKTYEAFIARSDARNSVLIDAARRAAKPALLFVKDIKHGLSMARSLRLAGMNADFVWGDASSEQRTQAVKRLVRGDTEVLVCSTIFQQGVDIPSLASVIVGSGGASTIASIQRVGRGMRTDGGRKSQFEVWDIWDVGVGTLERHAKARRRAYLREGYEVLDG